MKISQILLFPVSLLLPVFATQVTFAQTNFDVSVCDGNLEVSLLEPKIDPLQYGVIRADTISQTNISIPSLWWAKERFDPFKGKLINNWLAYPGQKRIDLIVNRQLWSLMNYLERYTFVNNFGSIAREYNYNLRVFNQSKQCLAVYQLNSKISPPKWELIFDSGHGEGFQIQLNEN